MPAANIQVSETPLVLYALRRADDALILGHRLSEWCGHAPMMEEDIALSNIALDLIGQARSSIATPPKPKTRTMKRTSSPTCATQAVPQSLLVEQPKGDFAQTLVRQFFYSAFADLYWRAMMNSRDATLAAIAAKSEKESAYHLRHASEWIIRLGDGTDESHQRAQAAIDHLWAFTGEMFAVDEGERALIHAGIAVDPGTLRGRWLTTLSEIVGEATLTLPQNDWMQQGAAPAATASISAISCPSCNRCSALFRGRHGERAGAR